MATTAATVEMKSIYSSSSADETEKTSEVSVPEETTTATEDASTTTTTTTTAAAGEETSAEAPQESAAAAATAAAKQNDSSDDSDSDSEDEFPPMLRMKSAIKLKSLTQDIPINLGKRSFRAMPAPDMDKVRKAATLPAYMSPEDVFRIMSGTNHEEDRSGLSVKFDNVKIRSYQQTIGDNPSVSYGPPIALDWKYEENDPKPLEEFEKERDGQRRPYVKLGLNYYQRKALLEGQGASNEDLKKVKKQVNRDKFKRAVTKYFLPVQPLEDGVESAGRKLKKLFKKKKRRNSLE